MPSRPLAHLLALVAPPLCIACRASLDDPDALLCAACRRDLPWRRRAAPERGFGLDAAWAPLVHAGPARALVSALKFEGATPVADLLAAAIAARVPRALLGDVLVPVPADPRRRRRRGYDQAELLADALGVRCAIPVSRCLSRGAGARQVGATRSARVAPGRIHVGVRGLAPASAVLVDDVLTTGATLGACAAALRAAGSRRVVALTATRAT